MRIEKIDLRHFGDLDLEVSLAPGFNVVHGPNEHGKSRLVAGIQAALCGRVKKRGRGIDELDRYRPWSGRAFRVGAYLHLADGRRVDVRQDLDEPARSKVTDIDLGRDITGDLMVDRAPDPSRLLGLERGVVPLTMLVRQTELDTLRAGSDRLQEMLQRAAAREATDATANRALARLDDLRAEAIGTERANSKRPLREAMSAEQEARRQRDEIARTRREVEAQREELAVLERSLEMLRVTRDEARTSELRREHQRLMQSIERLMTIEAELARPARPATALPSALRKELGELSLWARDAVPPPRPEVDRRELEVALGLLATLPAMPVGDLSVADPVMRAHRARGIAAGALEAHEAEGRDAGLAPSGSNAGSSSQSPPDPHRLRGLARALEARAPTPPEVPAPSARKTIWLALALAGIVAGLPLATIGLSEGRVGIAILSLLCVGLAVVGFAFAQREGARRAHADALLRGHAADLAVYAERRAEVLRELAGLGLVDRDGTLSPARVDEAAEAAERELDRERRRRQWIDRRTQLMDALARAEAELRRELERRGAATFEGYAEACAARAKEAQEASRRHDLERYVRQGEATLEAYERARAAFTVKRDALAAALLEAGIPSADPLSAEARAELDALLQSVELAEREAAERARLVTEHERLVADGTRDALEIRVQALTAEIDQLEARLPKRDPEPSPRTPSSATHPTSGAKDAAKLTHEIALGEADLARRMGQLEARLAQVPSMAEAEEAVDRAQREVERLRRFDRLIGHAMRLLAEARDHVHRDIAPRLSEALSAILPSLTADHWHEARIRIDTLSVSLRGRDGHWREVESLSTGTIEQVYLALRTILASAIGNPNEPCPLILDDVLAHADPERRASLIDWLVTLSETRQVILTTCDPDLVTQATARGAHPIPLSSP